MPFWSFIDKLQRVVEAGNASVTYTVAFVFLNYIICQCLRLLLFLTAISLYGYG